jgi:tRNA (guanine-N7-)-methyltransferase
MKIFFNLIDEIPPENREKQIHYFRNIFGNVHPLIVEIGSGNGHFLLENALQNPDYNFIGTEILGGRARKFNHKVEKRGMNNIIIFKGDVRQFVWEYLYEETVSEFIIMFPDPWPKKRHHKHRLLQHTLLQMLQLRLIKKGRISITTDHIPFRDWIIEEFKKTKGFHNVNRGNFAEYPDHFPKSLFEVRFRKENRGLFFIQYEKM